MESSIRDTAFTGSPLLSYGEAPAKRRLPRFIALLMMGVGAILAILFVWFWYFTRLPLPTDAELMAVIPASVALPDQAPPLWQEVARQNSPLPTIVGFIHGPEADKPSVAFAVRAFSLSDLFDGGPWAAWRLVTSGQATQTDLISPHQAFGDAWGMSHRPQLTVWPKRLLGAAKPLDLPEVLSGPIVGNTWQTPLNHEAWQGEFTPEGENFVALSAETSALLDKFIQANGTQIGLPEAGSLSWTRHEASLDYVLKVSDTFSSSSLVTLAEARGLMSTKNALLPDQIGYQSLVPLEQADASTTDLLNQGSFGFSVSDLLPIVLQETKNDANGLTCPGKVIASFDKTSSKNICSWLDICFIDVDSLVIAEQGDSINFCID